MPINDVLSKYSDWAFTTAIAIYVLAAIFYFAEQAFGRIRTTTSARAEPRELVTADGEVVGGPPTKDTAGGVGARTAPDRGGRMDRVGRMAVSLTVLAALVQLASIVLRGLATHRWPLGNMYEYISFLTLVAVACWLLAMRKFRVRRLGGWVLAPVLLLMLLNASVFYTLAAPVRPALQSYWLVIHVTIMTASSGVLLLPGVLSVFYLIRSANERNPKVFRSFAGRLPVKDTLDRVAYRTTVFALPLFTLAVICGAIWAESAWGSFWSWDPKETTALVDWIIYAMYLHSRSTAGWRGNRAATINVLGFAVNIFNLFFINLAVTGMHSYAGVG